MDLMSEISESRLQSLSDPAAVQGQHPSCNSQVNYLSTIYFFCQSLNNQSVSFQLWIEHEAQKRRIIEAIEEKTARLADA